MIKKYPIKNQSNFEKSCFKNGITTQYPKKRFVYMNGKTDNFDNFYFASRFSIFL